MSSQTTTPTIHGTWTALITPFAHGEIDEAALRNLVDWQLDHGVDGLVACGSTGETPTLTESEYATVTCIVVSQANGRVPVMVGVGTNDTRTTLHRMHLVTEAGADAALLVMPYYNRPTQEGMIHHVTHIHDHSTLPIVLYNVPGRTGCDLHAESVAQLATLERVVGIKEASGSVDRVSDIVALTSHLDTPFALLSGDDALALPIMSVGGHGVVSVISNIAPTAMRQLTEAASLGDYATARQLHNSLLPLCRALFTEPNPVPAKAVANLLGLCQTDVRLPLTPLSATGRAVLLQALAACPHVTLSGASGVAA